MEGILQTNFWNQTAFKQFDLTQIPCRAETAPVAKTCHTFAISSKEHRGREGLLAAQSAKWIVWGTMSYAMHKKWCRRHALQVLGNGKGRRQCRYPGMQSGWDSMNGREVNQGFTNAWSGTHVGNQGRAKRLCHMGKRWDRQIGTKRQPDLRELPSEVDVRGFCMWSLPAAWGYSQLLLLLHPNSD